MDQKSKFYGKIYLFYLYVIYWYIVKALTSNYIFYDYTQFRPIYILLFYNIKFSYNNNNKK